MWHEDILGKPFEQTVIQQPDDYSGKVVCTVVRRTTNERFTKGILYMHGFCDYFFQTEMAQLFNEHHFAFYALDLRKYGRSWIKGQTMYEARDLREYFADIDSAIELMKADGIDEVHLMGHSTGGLVATYYMAMDTLSVDKSQLPLPRHQHLVKSLILNSPFLDWNLSWPLHYLGIPIVSLLSSILPPIRIYQKVSNFYGECLLKEYRGEWTYDIRLKSMDAPRILPRWIRAIDKAQRYLHKHPQCIDIPILLMHSDKSIYYNHWHEDFRCSDCILSVKQISRRGRALGRNVFDTTIAGGVHDLALSAPSVRQQFYDRIWDFLSSQHL